MKTLFLLFCLMVIGGASPALAMCARGPIESFIITKCTKEDAEWATVVTENDITYRYRAYYVKGAPEALKEVNPCDTITLEKKVMLREEKPCCDAGTPDLIRECQDSVAPWLEAPEPEYIDKK